MRSIGAERDGLLDIGREGEDGCCVGLFLMGGCMKERWAMVWTKGLSGDQTNGEDNVVCPMC